MTAYIVQGNALDLPLPDESVDLIVTSPPYFALRSYQDDGTHYAGQIGSEETPQLFLEALWKATEEMVRVLKPSGSIFVDLGDKYAGSGGYNNAAISPGRGPASYNRNSSVALGGTPRDTNRIVGGDWGGIPAKSLMLLPERYRIGCVDRLGLIAREVLVWNKPNGLPESVRDRARRSHEDWVHLVKSPRYFSAVDEIRESYNEASLGRYAYRFGVGEAQKVATSPSVGDGTPHEKEPNPLGKLPGSVWSIPSEPLLIPEWARIRYDLPDHFAAFPQEWPRRLILGWSPSGICVECGEGRRPVVDTTEEQLSIKTPNRQPRGDLSEPDGNDRGWNGTYPITRQSATITGYACACSEPTAETTPARIVDPFGGTGTVALVANALGREGISIDLSHDYCRLAEWRCKESGHGRKALSKTWGERQQTLT